MLPVLPAPLQTWVTEWNAYMEALQKAKGKHGSWDMPDAVLLPDDLLGAFYHGVPTPPSTTPSTTPSRPPAASA